MQQIKVNYVTLPVVCGFLL